MTGEQRAKRNRIPDYTAIKLQHVTDNSETVTWSQKAPMFWVAATVSLATIKY